MATEVTTPDPWAAYSSTPIGQLEKRMFPGFAKLAVEQENLELVRLRISNGSERQAIVGILSAVQSFQDWPLYDQLPLIASKAGAVYLKELSSSKPITVKTVGGATAIGNGPIKHLQTSAGTLNAATIRSVTEDLFGGFPALKKAFVDGATKFTFETNTLSGPQGSRESDGALWKMHLDEITRAKADAWVRMMGYTPAPESSVYLVGSNLNNVGSGETISTSPGAWPLRNGIKWVIFGGGYATSWSTNVGAKFEGGMSSTSFLTGVLMPVIDDGGLNMPVIAHTLQGHNTEISFINDPRYASRKQHVGPGFDGMLTGTSTYNTFSWPGAEWYYAETPRSVAMVNGPPGLGANSLELGAVPVRVSYPSITGTGDSFSSWYVKPTKCLLPLIGAPGAYDLAMICSDPVWTSSVLWQGKSELGEDRSVILWTLDVNLSEMHVAIPFEWYGRYVATGFGFFTPLSGDKLAAAEKVVAENYTLTLTCSQFQAQALPRDIVERLDIYREYKKARDKNCLSNDFMKKEFVGGVRWQAVADHFAQLKTPIARFYGVIDASAATAISVDLYPLKDVSLAFAVSSPAGEGAGTLTVTPAGAVDVSSAEAVYDALAQGAKLTKGTLAQLEVFFGAAQAAGTAAEMASVTATAATFKTQANPVLSGRSAATMDFSAKSIAKNGYPAYWYMGTQDAYKCAIASEIVYKNAGSRMVKALLGFGSSALATAMWDK